MRTIVPFDLKKQYLDIEAEVKASIDRVFERSNFILGEELANFEEQFAKYTGSKNGCGVNSGTDALQIALMALDVGFGDEVITVSNISAPTICAIVSANAKPVFVDVGNDCNINVRLIEEKITKKTKVIIPVHLYGNPCKMDELVKIARKRNIKIVEDCAQAHGAKYLGAHVGTIGDIGCFSFYPTKNLGAYGDGGFIITDDNEIAKKVKMIRNYGEESKYCNKMNGINSRLDELQAAILCTKLKYLDLWNARRAAIAEMYDHGLKNLVETPPNNPGRVYHQYVIKVRERDVFRSFLSENGVHTMIHYPTPVHLQEAYSQLAYEKGSLPNTEKFSEQILSLPFYPEIEDKEVKQVIKIIKEFFKTTRRV